jgi:hypothetical protein
MLGGASASGVSGNKASISYGGFDYWLVRVDADGNKLWDKTFGGSGDDYVFGLTALGNGEYVVAGHSASDVSGDKTVPGFGLPDYWLLKVSEPVPQFVAGSGAWSAGEFSVQTAGAPGQTNVVQVSSNLVDWMPLMTNVFQADGTFMVEDSATTGPCRFYRLRVP